MRWVVRQPLRALDGTWPVEQPGTFQVTLREGTGTGTGTRPAPELAFAAVLDPRESDTSRLTPDELAATVAGGAKGARPRTGTPLWTWLLLAAVAAVVAEGALVRKG